MLYKCNRDFIQIKLHFERYNNFSMNSQITTILLMKRYHICDKIKRFDFTATWS